MKVLLANKFFFLNGGSETVFFQERDFLRQQGFDIVDFSMQDSRNFPSPYHGYFVGGRKYNGQLSFLEKIKSSVSLIHSPEAVRRISQLISDTKPDLLHCHNIYHQLTPSIIGAAKRFDIPVVLTLHDYKPVCPIYVRTRNSKPCSDCCSGDFKHLLKNRCADESFGRSFLLYAEAVSQRFLANYEKLDKLVAPSEFMANSMLHRFPRHKIDVVYNGIDVDALIPSGEDDGYVLYIGRLSKEKGLATLIDAYRRGGISLPLKVCGTGPLLDGFSKENIPGVMFLGHQSGNALQSVIRKASVVCVPSEWYENCPMSILEAMAYAKPVVASRIGGIPELVLDGSTGLLHESGDVDGLIRAINLLENDLDLRRRLGMAARKRAETNFSIYKHNSEIMRVYESVLH